MGSTSNYYKSNPTAKAKRNKQQSAYQKTAKGSTIKKNANKLNRKLGTYGNGDGKDAAHYKGSATKGRTQSMKINRSRK
jgi:hypothetical protein